MSKSRVAVKVANDEILATYPKVTGEEKAEILAALNVL